MAHGPTETVDGHRTKRAPVPVRVAVIDGPDKGLRLDAVTGTVLVGTHSDCQLRLTDPGVSRRHLSLELRGDRLHVCDLGSKNGTTYLGARFTELDLPVGATLQLSRTVLALLPVPRTGAVSDRTELGPLLGHSVAMRRVFSMVEQVAPTDASCLITGETGTGKELVARTLHQLSPRAEKPFVVVECGALNAQLANATLFGHVRGAFTGATTDAAGLVEAAEGGTLFLDDVAALPLELQPLLLRVLDTRTFQRVGDTRERSASFRVLASTREDLEVAAREGRFRQDLYYRLAGITLELEPLRQRMEDVVPLARHFAAAAGASSELGVDVFASLTAWHWPGNVRELENAVRAALVLGRAPIGDVAPTTGVGLEPFYSARDRVIQAFEKSYLCALLEQHQGSVVAVARQSGIVRSHLYKLLEAHGIEPDDYRTSG